MRSLSRLMGHLLLAACLMQAAPAFAVTVGQVDSFEDGTTQGWVVGRGGAQHPAPPAVVSGGHAGAEDHFLLLTSTGTQVEGPGAKLSVINSTQWTGDYLAAGVGAIALDLKNPGETDLSLRLMLADFEPTTIFDTGNIALSGQPVSLPAGSGWIRVEFPLSPRDLIALNGTAAAALRNVFELRIIHSQAASLPPPAVDALMGVDNITAMAGAVATVVGDTNGYCACTVAPDEPLSCLLQIGNSRGVTPSQIAQEWLVIGFGPISTGIATNIFFINGQGALVSLEQAMSNPAAATFPFNHAGNSHALGNLTLGAAGIGSGNFLLYAYAFSTTAVSDFGNAPGLVIENVVLLNVQ